MKQAILIASTALLTASFSYAGGEGWMHDFEAAKKKAADEKKDLLIDFTGSDWCGPCIQLSERILSKESFKTAAMKNYILVELDYPRTEEGLAKVSEATQLQNQGLAQKYEIQYFPTILLTDAQGLPYAQTGGHPGTPEDYLAHLAELQKAKTTRDENFEKAGQLEGVEKAKALYAGITSLPITLHGHYGEQIKTIKENDPEDQTGIVAAEEKRIADAEAAAAIEEKMNELQKGLGKAMEANDSAKALKLVDDYIAEGKLEGAARHEATGIKVSILSEVGKTDEALKLVDTYVAEQKLEGMEKQQILGMKINTLMQKGDLDAVEKVAKEIIAVEPDNEFSKQVQGFLDTQLKQMKEQKKTEEAPAEKE